MRRRLKRVIAAVIATGTFQACSSGLVLGDEPLGCESCATPSLSQCDSGCDTLGQCGCGDDPFSLGGLLGLTDCSRWKIGGWTEVGYYDNNIPLSQAQGDLLSFQDVSDQVQVNQQWLYAERKANVGDGWGIGARFDAIYGVDAQKTQSFGNPGAGIRNNGSFDASLDHGNYGWAFPQLYAEVANDTTSIKVGHFFTPLGYEVIPATGNFFYSHSLTMFNSEPFTHTGVLATYAGIEDLTLYGGWSLGWDTGFDQLNQGNNFLGGFSAKLTDCVTFAYLNTYGNFGWRDGGGDNSYSHSIVVTTDLTEKIQHVVQSDMVRTNNPPVSSYDTIGLNNYLFYKMSDKVKLGTRIEWWKADGVSFYEYTAGVNFIPYQSVVIRPEFRQDWAPGIGLDENTFAVDAIVSY